MRTLPQRLFRRWSERVNGGITLPTACPRRRLLEPCHDGVNDRWGGTRLRTQRHAIVDYAGSRSSMTCANERPNDLRVRVFRVSGEPVAGSWLTSRPC